MSGRAGRPPKRVLIVDGYNVINARRDAPLNNALSLADARDRLISLVLELAAGVRP